MMGIALRYIAAPVLAASVAVTIAGATASAADGQQPAHSTDVSTASLDHGGAYCGQFCGDFSAYDDHPVSACVDQGSHWREDYFDESPIADVGWKHFDLPGEPAQEQKYERFWRLGQIVTAVAGAGLTIRSLEEFSTIYETYWRAKDPRVPGQFVLIATKPKEGAKAAKTPRRAPRP